MKLFKGIPKNVKALGFVSFLNDAASEMIYPLLPIFLTSVLGVGAGALGVIEGIGAGLENKNLVIQYENFEEDICAVIDEYDEKHPDDLSGIECSSEGSNYYVLAQGQKDATAVVPEEIWNDLTSKLRWA